MEHPVPSAKEFLGNLKKLKTNIKQLEHAANDLHAEVGFTKLETHRTERDLGLQREVRNRQQEKKGGGKQARGHAKRRAGQAGKINRV